MKSKWASWCANPKKWPRLLCMALISFYQVAISPLKPRCCRFVPTCSEYSKQAFRRFGFWKGGLLTVWRLLRCHPFYRGALFDPVPEHFLERRRRF